MNSCGYMDHWNVIYPIMINDELIKKSIHFSIVIFSSNKFIDIYILRFMISFNVRFFIDVAQQLLLTIEKLDM